MALTTDYVIVGLDLAVLPAAVSIKSSLSIDSQTTTINIRAETQLTIWFDK